uniref:Zinc finger CCCH-type with G patch domain-containing protein n=1 Tax=Callorhinchus milii TaxID=7868 RepID=A0A4W3IJ88_CALMI|eukprot:gi/632939366/ref/XP_007909781.1/ PREDICTED: zinc finger CCCH-type with G patch domain-containing protein [Callorhinchus milii]
MDMDEASLEAAIELYKAQVRQVESALAADSQPEAAAGAGTEGQADLLRLRDDLRQLIHLTESSLLSVRKSQLLERLDRAATAGPEPEAEAEPGPAREARLDAEYTAFQAAMSEPGGEEYPRERGGGGGGDDNAADDDDDDEDGEEADERGDEELSGSRVSAPYRTPWGQLQYHDAMIVGPESSEPPEPTVRVLWIHPTHRSMRPCPWYLSGTCRFPESCRYSHGEVVAVSELREGQELDLSSLEVGSACLAKHEDEIWYPAKILDMDSGYFTVKFDSLLQKELVVEGDGIMPVPRSEESSSSSDSEDDGDQLGYAKVFDANSMEKVEWTPPCTSTFAGWETHTRGMGSKLMAKMGYEFGKGLGKNAEGRVEPVEAVVLPPGKSLDQCAEILQNKREGKLNHLHKKKHKRKDQGGLRVAKVHKSRQTVFDFLNDKLGTNGQSSGSTLQPMGEKNSKECYKGSTTMKKTLNIKVFQIMENIEHTEKDIVKITEALSRNVGRGKALTAHLEEKLSNAKKQLSYLKSQEASAQHERKKADTHKKMTKF